MTSSYPRFGGETPLAAESARFEQVMEITGAIRNIRNELGVQPVLRGRAILRVHDQAEADVLAGGTGLVALLSKLEEVSVVIGGEDPSPAGSGVAGTVEIFLPMEGLVDLAKERARLEKNLAGIEGWLKGCRAKLANEKFVANAPEQVVQQQKDLLVEKEAEADKLRERLAALD